MKKLFIITGEHSGDLHAAKVVQELKKTMPDLDLVLFVLTKKLRKEVFDCFDNSLEPVE